MTELKLQNKIALITGGTTGIGLATAQRFVAEGATVIVTGRNADTLQSAKETLGDKVDVIRSDAADPADIKALFAQVKDKYGHLDVLFLNAGIAHFVPWAEETIEGFDKLFAVNVRGPYLAIQQAIPLLKQGSSVLFTTSVINQGGMPGASGYAATKAAVRSLVRTAAAELAPLGVRVNAVSPGPIETPIFGKMGMPKEAMEGMIEGMLSRIPLGRVGQASEIANAALFLVSDEASFIQGTELAIDGGMSQI